MFKTFFRRRLRLQDGEEMDYLPHSLFRKYIAYAQKYVNPQLSEEAKTVLKEFYFQLRKQFQSGDCTPITTRQLRSLIRLTQVCFTLKKYFNTVLSNNVKIYLKLLVV